MSASCVTPGALVSADPGGRHHLARENAAIAAREAEGRLAALILMDIRQSLARLHWIDGVASRHHARFRKTRIVSMHDARHARVDNGPEFISKDLDLWAWSKGITLDFSRPGKPTDNAFVESFNGKVRAECIDQNWFLSLDDARANARLIEMSTVHDSFMLALAWAPGLVVFRGRGNESAQWLDACR